MASNPPSRPPSNQSTGWRDVQQSPTTENDGTGRAVRGYRVTFTTMAGHPGSVFVSEARYTPDNVRAAIAALAATLDAVGKLTG